MSATTKTYQEILTFINAAAGWLGKNDKESKFKYGLRKVLKQAEKAWGTYQEQVEDLNIEHCIEEKGVIVKDTRGDYQFSKDGVRKRNAARKILFESSVSITPHLAKEIPADLTDDQRDAFAGFVLPELVDDPDEAAA